MGVSRGTILNRIDAGTLKPSGTLGTTGKRITYVFDAEYVDRLIAARAAELFAEADRMTAEASARAAALAAEADRLTGKSAAERTTEVTR